MSKNVRYNFRWNKHEHIRMSARSFGPERSLFFSMEPWTPPIVNMEGKVSYYAPERIGRMRKRIDGVEKRAYLQDILDRILDAGMSDKERIARICAFVADALYYNPVEQPQVNDMGSMLTDAVELFELHDGRCGQGVCVTLALLKQAGFECRRRDVFHHVTCEARYGGRWHLADALMFGANQPERGGEVLNVAQLRREPCFADAWPLQQFAYTPEELLSRDGYRILGYTFGDWGTLTYYSWYMGGEEDYPPMMPCVLPPDRLPGGKVRLHWSRSGKRNGGPVRYRVAVYIDRKRTQRIFSKETDKTSVVWRVPETNRMYFVGVTATDDHVLKNPDTWYPEAVNNFVLVPKGQYGWYGVL
jgi:hypothetical protein